jgi:hypothetical protein
MLRWEDPFYELWYYENKDFARKIIMKKAVIEKVGKSLTVWGQYAVGRFYDEADFCCDEDAVRIKKYIMGNGYPRKREFIHKPGKYAFYITTTRQEIFEDLPMGGYVINDYYMDKTSFKSFGTDFRVTFKKFVLYTIPFVEGVFTLAIPMEKMNLHPHLKYSVKEVKSLGIKTVEKISGIPEDSSVKPNFIYYSRDQNLLAYQIGEVMLVRSPSRWFGDVRKLNMSNPENSVKKCYSSCMQLDNGVVEMALLEGSEASLKSLFLM